MSDYQVMLLVKAMAVQARIEAMKAQNAHWAAIGQSPAYGEDAFLGCAADLQAIAEQMERP